MRLAHLADTSASLIGVTSGRPMKRRASSGEHSTLTVNFMAGSRFGFARNAVLSRL